MKAVNNLWDRSATIDCLVPNQVLVISGSDQQVPEGKEMEPKCRRPKGGSSWPWRKKDDISQCKVLKGVVVFWRFFISRLYRPIICSHSRIECFKWPRSKMGEQLPRTGGQSDYSTSERLFLFWFEFFLLDLNIKRFVCFYQNSKRLAFSKN